MNIVNYLNLRPAFRNRKTGRVVTCELIHDIEYLPPDEIDEYEPGFVTPRGEFVSESGGGTRLAAGGAPSEAQTPTKDKRGQDEEGSPDCRRCDGDE